SSLAALRMPKQPCDAQSADSKHDDQKPSGPGEQSRFFRGFFVLRPQNNRGYKHEDGEADQKRQLWGFGRSPPAMSGKNLNHFRGIHADDEDLHPLQFALDLR